MAERLGASQEIEKRKGKLIVIFGPMFSGKSGELIDRVDAEGHVGARGIIIKPSNDIRYEADKVVTHSGRKIDAFRVDQNSPQEIINLLGEIESKEGYIDIVGIDEGQFFEKNEFINVVEELIDRGKVVIVAGLPTDFRDEPFGAVPYLTAKADLAIQRITAKCTYRYEDGSYCREVATKTQRIGPAHYNDPIVVVGGSDLYEARCRQHHIVPKD